MIKGHHHQQPLTSTGGAFSACTGLFTDCRETDDDDGGDGCGLLVDAP